MRVAVVPGAIFARPTVPRYVGVIAVDGGASCPDSDEFSEPTVTVVIDPGTPQEWTIPFELHEVLGAIQRRQWLPADPSTTPGGVVARVRSLSRSLGAQSPPVCGGLDGHAVEPCDAFACARITGPAPASEVGEDQ